jgi:hypothetical protein
MKQNFFKRVPLACAVVIAAAALTSCGKDSTAPGSTAAAIAPAVTPPATAQVATAIQGPAVTVTDASGRPVVGAQVQFDVTAGGGALQYPIATTDDQGVASAGLWQVGPKVGTNTSTATVSGVAPVTFTVATSPGPPTKISAFAGNAQQAAPGTAVANPLSARVVDAGGNPKPGVDVTFAVASGGGSLSSTQGTTDANGVATSGTWTLGSGQCGQTVTATAGTIGTTFTGDSRGSTTVGATENGTLSSTDCVINGAFADEYNVTTASGAMNVSLSSAAFDAVLNVVTSDGSAIIAADDNSAGGTNSTLRLITAAGDKALRATSAGAGQTGAYTLSSSSTSSDVTDCSTVYIEIGASTDQSLATTDCQTNFNPPSGDWTNSSVSGDAYRVYIPAGVTVQISETAQPLDALLSLYDPSGKLVTYRDNGGVGASGTETITYTATSSGFYKVVAGTYCLLFDDPYQAGCDYGAYTLKIVKP